MWLPHGREAGRCVHRCHLGCCACGWRCSPQVPSTGDVKARALQLTLPQACCGCLQPTCVFMKLSKIKEKRRLFLSAGGR